MHSRDHRTSAEKQEPLEESVGEKVKYAEAVAPDAEADEHVAEL